MADAQHLVGPVNTQTEVLTNTDLLYTIFTFIPLASDDRDSYLVQCAPVSQTFHETAIRVLWRNLHSLLPLWHLLAPANTSFPHWQYVNTLPLQDYGQVLTYLQAVSAAELYRDPVRWRRFLGHATHVRKVTLPGNTTSEIDDVNSLLERAVLMQNGGVTVLPLLHTIKSFRPCDDTLTPFFTLAVRHAMFTLTWSSQMQTVSTLCKLREASPFIKKIDLLPLARAGSGLNWELGLTLIQELAGFSRLQEVKVSQCTGFEAFRLLTSGPPNLTCLNIRQITSEGVWVGPVSVVSVHGLHQLSLNGDASTLSRLFGLVRFHSLQTATIRLNASTETQLTAIDIKHVLALFHNAVSTSDFQSLQFAPNPHCFRVPGQSDHTPTLRDLLAPLLPIRNLRSFTLTAPPCAVASLDDVDIIALASAWPMLEYLCIDRGFTANSHVSISAIHSLYTHCPHLQVLSIPHMSWPTIGVEIVPEPLHRSPSHPLRELSLGKQLFVTEDRPLFGPDLSDSGVEAMARYLLDLFPCLDLDHCSRELDRSKSGTRRKHLPPSVYYDDRWGKVVRHIYSMCRARDGL